MSSKRAISVEEGSAEQLRGVRDARDARGQLREVLDGPSERLLHVDDGERRLLEVERVLVPHESPPVGREHLSTRRPWLKTDPHEKENARPFRGGGWRPAARPAPRGRGAARP